MFKSKKTFSLIHQFSSDISVVKIYAAAKSLLIVIKFYGSCEIKKRKYLETTRSLRLLQYVEKNQYLKK